MQIDSQAVNLAGSPHNVRLDKTPDTCPRCHRSVHPKFVGAFLTQERSLCQATFRCTNLLCQEIFIATYRLRGESGGFKLFNFDRVEPQKPKHTRFPEVIEQISPNFSIIFNQAEDAESSGLDQLVGIGLRKALEFLIKDFSASENPDKADKIRGSALSQCLTNYVNDPNVKECARRAAWLGNDETHYVKKWENKDISDLKLLVRLTVNWIESTLLTRKYISDMQDGA